MLKISRFKDFTGFKHAPFTHTLSGLAYNHGLLIHSTYPQAIFSDVLCEWQSSDTSDAGRSHGNDNTVNVVHLDHI